MCAGIFGVHTHEIEVQASSLFINKSFVLNEMFQRNASKFAILYII